MAEYRNCKQCGKNYLVGSEPYSYRGFCSYFCSENYETEHRVSSSSSNSDSFVEDVIYIAGAILKGKPKPSKKSNERTAEEDRAYWLSPERERERKEYEEQRRKEWEGKEITTLSDYTMGREYKGEIPFTLGAYHEEIDFIVDLGAKEITKRLARAPYYKDTTKIMSRLEKYREEYKEKLRLYFDRLNSGKKIEKYKMTHVLHDFWMKCHKLTGVALKREYLPGPLPLVVCSVLLTVVSIIAGIILRMPILPILGFVIGWIMIAIWESKWAKGKIKFNEVVTGMTGSLYIAVIGIIAGVVLHSFLIGLFGVIAGIVLLVLAGKRWDQPA